MTREEMEKLASHRLRDRIEAVTSNGNEAHKILPEIWPIIEPLLKLTDACEQGRVVITDSIARNPQERNIKCPQHRQWS